MDTQFGELADGDISLRPASRVDAIDAVNDRVYNDLNNGVYKCGFAGSQAAYDSAVAALFATLDWLEQRLGQTRYVAGDRLTEADVRLFTTLVRFDAVYAFHFRCNLRLLRDYSNLSNYVRELYSVPAFRDTTDFLHIRHHYYRSHETIHPSRIVPVGPAIDLDAGHNRSRFGGLAPISSARESNFLKD
jgi:putative glutathione S-transferase